MQRAEKIIIADDHPLFRAALKQIIIQAKPEAVLLEVDSLLALQHVVEHHADADLVLLDLHMPDSNGFCGLVSLRSQNPAMPVVVISGNEDPSIMSRAINYGASGFIPKSSSFDTILAGISTVIDGDVWLPETVDPLDIDGDEATFAAKLQALTPAQLCILMKLTEGLLNKQIAHQLTISEATVKAHVTAIFRKLKVYSRTQAVIEVNRLQVSQDVVALDA